ncbi:MAG: fibro-slime domain-containing protein [Planctomycetota bacterium]
MFNRSTIINLVSYHVLAIAAVVMLLIPDVAPIRTVQASTPSDQITLVSKITDFRNSHPDMGVTPANGFGHYAGNVNLTLGPSYVPTFSGNGALVSQQWRQKTNHPIPPHLYKSGIFDFNGARVGGSIFLNSGSEFRAGSGTPVIATNATNNNAVTLNSGSTIEGDLLVGPGGNANAVVNAKSGSSVTGTIGALSTVIPMPTITVPNIGPMTNSDWKVESSTYVLSNDLHIGKGKVDSGGRLRINGHVTMVVDDDFEVNSASRVEVMANSSLQLYVGGELKVNSGSSINNNTKDNNLVTVYITGSKDVDINSGSGIYMNVAAPNSELVVNSGSRIDGSFIGQSIYLNSGSEFVCRPGSSPVYDRCGTLYADTEGLAPFADTGAISSSTTFNQWFTDVMGVNLSTAHLLRLTNNGSGVYEYLDDNFFPIDDRLLGNEDGDSHNYYFTLWFEADFIYDACTDQFFEFEGDDDAWMFVGSDLGLDLGGIRPLNGQYLEMHRLDLVDGQTYTLRFFYAQRNGSSSRFRLRTNLPLQGVPSTLATAGFD